MNPYIVIAVMLVIDIITLPFIIRKILKKDGKKKGVKIAVLVAVFIAVEAVFSFFFINASEKNIYYDRLGNDYTKLESVVYYDKIENEYLLCETADGKEYFISGAMMRPAEQTYIDKDGYLVYDSKNTFKETSVKGVYSDAKGNEYHKASDVRWSKDGKIAIISE